MMSFLIKSIVSSVISDEIGKSMLTVFIWGDPPFGSVVKGDLPY